MCKIVTYKIKTFSKWVPSSVLSMDWMDTYQLCQVALSRSSHGHFILCYADRTAVMRIMRIGTILKKSLTTLNHKHGKNPESEAVFAE